MDLVKLMSQDKVQERFKELIGKRSAQFISSVLNVAKNNDLLAKADPSTVMNAAVVAATLDLPIDPNLGFAYIVPYGGKAQFQLGYKGLTQLAIRSGQYKTIGCVPVYDGQLIEENALTSEYIFDWSVKSSKLIGFAAYFKLINGFEKTVFWPVEKIDAHGKRFSQTYKKGFGLWKDDFEAMALKTVLKHLLSKWGILSIEMQSAVKFDQGAINDPDTGDVDYVDVTEQKSFDENEVVEAKTTKK